jgi:multiple sugar transport system substrate-binding protein
MSEGDMLNYLYADQATAVTVTSSTLTGIKRNRPDLYEKIGFANYPIEQGLRAVPHLVGWTYCLMTDKPDRQKAAWKFIAKMTSSASLKESNEINGHIPVRKSVADASTFFKTDPVFKDVLAINFGGPVQARPPVATYPVISNAIATQMEMVVTGKMTPDQAIDEAAKVSMADWQRTQR